MHTDTVLTAWRDQRPEGAAWVLDHIAHFVPDMDAATAALERLGFTLTPLSAQHHRIEPGAPLVPAGSSNRCAMLRAGYLEFLTPTADTPVARRMRAAIARYVGPHLVCFGTSDAARAAAHLAASGFAPLPPVALERRIETPTGEDTARFAVVRVPPEVMPEGRIQVVEHRTPELLWQPRWLDHPNRALGLLGAILCVVDADEAAARYARFCDCPGRRIGALRVIETARGRLVLLDAAALAERLNMRPPALPWIAGTALLSVDMTATRAWLDQAGFVVTRLGGDAAAVAAPPGLGGVFVFQAADSVPLAP